MGAKAGLFWLKMTKRGKNTNKFGIWNLKIKFHSLPVYDKKYLKTKVREYDSMIKTNFPVNGMLKENMHYTCIACITTGSVMKMEKKYFPLVCLEEFKSKLRKYKCQDLSALN